MSDAPPPPSNPPEPSLNPPAGPGWLILARDIKLSHSIFALPFALLATFLAAGGWPRWHDLVLIIVCMVSARTFAMLINRYLDRRIDAANPRTASRALPSGRLASGTIITGIALSAAILIAGAAAFGLINHNWWAAIFSPLVLLWLGLYSLTKRFTLLCHLVLGIALAMSPLAATLAINPSYLQFHTVWWLAGFVMLWVAGFDVIYALQDIDVDQRLGLHSIPAKLGPTAALLLAKTAHVGSVICLGMAERASPQLDRYFTVGMVLVGVILIYEHRAASRGQFHMAFFTLNGFISLILGGLGIADVLIQKAGPAL
jgi:4-hydroxybenzoate polyprenyltransferase